MMFFCTDSNFYKKQNQYSRKNYIKYKLLHKQINQRILKREIPKK